MNDSPRRGLPPMLIAALVTAMFVVPIVVAWWFALIQPPDNGAGMLNRGMLIAPPLDINADAAMTPLTTVPLEPGEWAMMNFSQNACDPVCEEALKKLATIHAVLGHDGTRVRYLTLNARPGTQSGTRFLVDAAAVARLQKAITDGTSLTTIETGTVFFDWRGQVMMAFAADAPPGDIKKDLKRLLRGSKIK